MEKITLGAGCFWCIEAVMQRLKGILKVEPGYMGGNYPNPTYEEVCSGKSGFIEVVELSYDALHVDLETILEVFWTSHDPTTPGRQGNDIGPQYSSVIFYYNENQKTIAEKSIAIFAKSIWTNPIVTKLLPAETFYPAEDYHHNYYEQNKSQAYCHIIVTPKINKLKQQFADKLKK